MAPVATKRTRPWAKKGASGPAASPNPRRRAGTRAGRVRRRAPVGVGRVGLGGGGGYGQGGDGGVAVQDLAGEAGDFPAAGPGTCRAVWAVWSLVMAVSLIRRFMVAASGSGSWFGLEVGFR